MKKDPVVRERLRCVGLLLSAVGSLQLAGHAHAAKFLDDVALAMEHPELADKIVLEPKRND